MTGLPPSTRSKNIKRKVDDIQKRNNCQRSIKTRNNIVQKKANISYITIRNNWNIHTVLYPKKNIHCQAEQVQREY